MLEEIMNYKSFQEISIHLDKTKYSLPPEAQKIIYNIKKKLDIKDIMDIRKYEKFEKPIIKKRGDILDEIYKNLNKITASTYKKLAPIIIDCVSNLNENEEFEVCNKIFEIITNNYFCCDIFAKLYSELVLLNDTFKYNYERKVKEYLEITNHINYVSPNDNYDQYCDYVKEVDKIKNFTQFLIKGIQYQICTIDIITNSIIYFQEKLITNIDLNESIYINENYISNIFIMIKEMIDFLVFHEKWEIIKKNNNHLLNIQGLGKNGKIKFTIMDINDIIIKNE